MQEKQSLANFIDSMTRKANKNVSFQNKIEWKTEESQAKTERSGSREQGILFKSEIPKISSLKDILSKQNEENI